LLRGNLAIRALLDRPAEVWARPGIPEAAATVGDAPEAPGPSRSELVALIAG
jgi:hypothetical protein